MNRFEIGRMITISTAHISKETRRMLDNSLIEDLTYYAKDGFGWFIHIPPMDRLDDSDIPDDLAACLRYALVLGCVWLGFDRDAQPCVLPLYENAA